MKKLLITYLKGDLVIWIITLLLLALSIVTVYSFVPILVKMEGSSPFHYLFKHLIYVVLGFSSIFFLHRVDPKYFSQIAKFSYYFAVALLIFTFFFGKEVNGAGRWVSIPLIGLTFQSSDFAKLALFLYLSRLLVRKKDKLNDWKEGILPLMIPIVVICGLIFKDNLSTSLLVFALAIAVLFIGQVPMSKLLTMGGAGVLLLVIVIGIHSAIPQANILPRYETWKNRLANKVTTEQNVVENAQALDARRAIHAGSWVGLGVGDGKLKEYLPEAYADFYYASFVEEFGFVSALFLTFLYMVLLFRIIRIGLKSEQLFETYVCMAIGLHLLAQASINMLVCTGVLPVTGQNMPFLAMGGSALLMACVSIGVIQAIAVKQSGVSTSQIEEE
ncbi:MAG: FtsW/RodA/SpoVE family cell cycle protein [Bacteroidota bacterium]